MAVKRILANVAAPNVEEVRDFYIALFDLDIVMEFDWISTLASSADAPVQISIASQGGSDTAVPDLSIEVDDVEAVYQMAKQLGHCIEYGLVDEPWGVRRFYLRDPAGKLLNVLAHLPK